MFAIYMCPLLFFSPAGTCHSFTCMVSLFGHVSYRMVFFSFTICGLTQLLILKEVLVVYKFQDEN